jgi:hypothetical protein
LKLWEGGKGKKNDRASSIWYNNICERKGYKDMY